MTRTLLCKLVTLSVSLAVSGAAIAAAYSEDNPTSELSSDAQKLEKLRKRAAQGLPDAQISLGMIYFTGVGATQDYVEAARWFRLAAKQGFPDATPEFFDVMSRAMSLGLGRPLDVVAPLASMRKEDVIRLGRSMGVPLELTLSCMNPQVGDSPCGQCSKCRERDQAFSNLSDE